MAGLSILTATAAPNLQEYIELARLTKARGDVQVLAVSMVRLMNDVGSIIGGPDRVQRPELLIGPGEPPVAATADAVPWSAPAAGSRVNTFTAHLVDNAAGYPSTNQLPRWRGPYLEDVPADPWGSRYAANAAFLRPGSGYLGVVVSAGPNRIVETPFRLVRFGVFGDDVVSLVSSGR